MEVLRLSLAMVLGMVLPLVVQLWDRRRMPPEQRARTWNYATWGAALYAFGPASMLGWMWVTRRRWVRCMWGALAFGGLMAATQTVDVGVELATGGSVADPFAPALTGGVSLVAAAVLLLAMEVVASLLARVRGRRG